MNIHPTALVSPLASLAEDLEVGPHSLIGDEVTIGKGCVVGARAVIEGATTIGENNVIGCGAVLGSPPQDLAFQDHVTSGLRIGHGNTIREYVTIHRGTRNGSSTVVGDDCCLMGGSHVGHNVRLGDRITVSNNCLLGGYVEVGDGAVLGAGSVFHQFLHVGPLVVVSAGTRSVKDIPPYVLAFHNNFVSGINIPGLRAAGWTEPALMEIQEAFTLVFGSNLNISQALQRARALEWSPPAKSFFDFIASSQRGVCTREAGEVIRVERDRMRWLRMAQIMF